MLPRNRVLSHLVPGTYCCSNGRDRKAGTAWVQGGFFFSRMGYHCRTHRTRSDSRNVDSTASCDWLSYVPCVLVLYSSATYIYCRIRIILHAWTKLWSGKREIRIRADSSVHPSLSAGGHRRLQNKPHGDTALLLVYRMCQASMAISTVRVEQQQFEDEGWKQLRNLQKLMRWCWALLQVGYTMHVSQQRTCLK